MIVSDREGEEQLKHLFRYMDACDFSDYERRFLEDIQYKGQSFKMLTSKQKQLVAYLYGKEINGNR